MAGYIYADNAATTKISDVALKAMMPCFENLYGNPSSLHSVGQEAKEALDTADVILAKGMANCETMHGCGYNVYYAFLVKCSRFVQVFNQPKLTPMLVREKK